MTTPPASTPVRVRVAAIIVRADEVLLVRHEKEGKTYWMLPGGGLDHGETLAEAVARELREEIRLEVRVGDLVLVNDTIAPDRHRHILHLCFTAEIVSGAPALGSDPRVVEVAWHPVETLPELAFYPDAGQALLEEIHAGFPRRARYLGNLWR